MYFWLKQRSESARYRLGQFEREFVRGRVLDEHARRVARFAGILNDNLPIGSATD